MNIKKITSFTYAIALAITVNAVGLPSGEGNANDVAVTLHEDSFSSTSFLLSGATQTDGSKYRLEAKGGMGWYWDQGLDASQVQGIQVDFGTPISKFLYLQLFFGDHQVLRKKIPSGKSTYTLTLGTSETYKHVTSVNLVSQSSQTIDLERVCAVDAQGQVITDIQNVNDSQEVVSTSYYNIIGERIPQLAQGVNIVRYQMRDGSVKSRKVMVQ